MKAYNLFITTFLALNIIGCDNQKDKESYFSFDENTLKAMYQANEKVDFTLVNTHNKAIDSVVYFANNKRVSSVKGGGKFTLDLTGKKLGYQNIKALVYFEGDTVSTKTRVEVAAAVAPKLLKYTVVNTYDHDVDAFTEGYEFYRDTLVESTGQNGKSYFAKVDYKTGKAYKKVDLDQQYFGEGITIINDKVYQLTWQNGEGFVYDAKTMKKIKSFKYDKTVEGWGMTNDGKMIYHSDGTEKIWTMDPETLKLVDFVNVYTNDSKIKSVNELEWINGKIYGNIWQKDAIAVINPQSGAVEAVLDLSALRAKVTNKEAEVLNGIAYRKATNTIFVTGKNWNKTFEIKVSE
ncbi:glutaminyl-peptide cyclotransferase [Flavobacterium sp. J49]|uniref:glutaminyl-peptide cyclotransferase n=1 Tax=Flavobacterium sp. J49 TaxID=2718534 RepID=UPI0015945F4A|nr:glutaminyl-peptide cyclotransferase [Flavobacterium sp. J49]MBF6642033.1 glutaminyl-peptide cyclotransferase [Flavobacterium sp. J49]NIC03281.1 glutaminyl-peptide cyclotransferase [Flavobacterium sp. J49]